MHRHPLLRPPTPPGEILDQEFLVPLGMTQKKLAECLACDVKVINRIVNGRSAVTAKMALKLGAVFGTSAKLAQRPASRGSLGGGARAG